MTLFDHNIRALRMLAGCPDGATAHALAQHGFDRDCLDALTVAGFCHAIEEHFRHGQIVTRFHVTDDGRRAAS